MGDADRGAAVSDQEILAVLANADERLRMREVADELPIGDETLSDRLDDLYERGVVATEDDVSGERWYLAPGARDEVTIPDEEVETDVEAQATKTTGVEASPRDEETPETPPPDPQEDPTGPIDESAADAIEAFDPPGTADEKERRREALRQAYAYLRDRGRADRKDIASDVFPEASGGYDDSRIWWEQVVRPGLETLPGVESQGEDGEWRFAEGEDEAPRN